MTDIWVNQSPKRQAVGEAIAYSVDFTDVGTPSGAGTTTAFDATGASASATLSGSDSLSGNINTCKLFTPTSAQTYTLLCTVTISGNTVVGALEVQVFLPSTPATITNGYATLAQFKDYAFKDGKSDRVDDGVIARLIEATSRFIDAQTERQFYSSSLKRYYDIPGDDEIWFGDDLLSIRSLRNGDQGAELIINPGFETAGAGGADIWGSWTETVGDGALADETTTVHGEDHAAKLTASTTYNTLIFQSFTVTPGLSYNLKFWTAGDGTYAGRYVVYNNTGSANIIAATATGVTSATWTEVTTSFVAPAACVSVKLSLLCPGTSGGICYFDDVSVIKRGTLIGRDQYNLIPSNGSPKYGLKLKDNSTVTWDTDAATNSEAVIEIDGSWGYCTTHPHDINLACLDIATQAYHRRFGQNVTGAPVVSSGGIVIGPRDVSEFAQAIIRHYARMVW